MIYPSIGSWICSNDCPLSIWSAYYVISRQWKTVCCCYFQISSALDAIYYLLGYTRIILQLTSIYCRRLIVHSSFLLCYLISINVLSLSKCITTGMIYRMFKINIAFIRLLFLIFYNGDFELEVYEISTLQIAHSSSIFLSS